MFPQEIEMNRTEILEEFSSCTEQMITKGKRSKRTRPSSSSVSSRSGGEFNCNSSPASSSGISTNSSEDEDMANCLILLARGGETIGSEKTGNKLVSLKFTKTETSSAANNGKVGGGACDYECKTCSRTFPSFQALGGHRASHKKPKLAIDSTAPPREGESAGVAAATAPPPPWISAQSAPPSGISLLRIENKLSKIHGCSVCGSEFGSGQALGGHMRRHRSVVNSSTAAVGPSALNLDLNLPAPQEDDFHGHFPANQQPRIVFAAAALVDCHY